jgi:hypothetical protein
MAQAVVLCHGVALSPYACEAVQTIYLKMVMHPRCNTETRVADIMVA